MQLDGWIAKRRSQVEQLSQGRVGYVYLPEMSSAVYEEVVADALGRQRNREALIVDVRFNKGGYLANTLVEFLTGSGSAQGMARSWPRLGKGRRMPPPASGPNPRWYWSMRAATRKARPFPSTTAPSRWAPSSVNRCRAPAPWCMPTPPG